jgi:hypothetical protein
MEVVTPLLVILAMALFISTLGSLFAMVRRKMLGRSVPAKSTPNSLKTEPGSLGQYQYPITEWDPLNEAIARDRR